MRPKLKDGHGSPRWLCDPELSGFLRTDKAHHWIHVLRFVHGQEIRVTNGAGCIYRASLKKISSGLWGYELEGDPEFQIAPPRTIVGLALSKVFDGCLEKASEWMVSEIVPVETSRSLEKSKTDKIDSWKIQVQKSLFMGCEQAQSAWLPRLRQPISWQELLTGLSTPQRYVFGSEQRENRSLSQSLDQLKKSCLPWSEKEPPFFLLGPEGGFSQQEHQELRLHHFENLSLGPGILRVETAFSAALALIRIAQG